MCEGISICVPLTTNTANTQTVEKFNKAFLEKKSIIKIILFYGFINLFKVFIMFF